MIPEPKTYEFLDCYNKHLDEYLLDMVPMELADALADYSDQDAVMKAWKANDAIEFFRLLTLAARDMYADEAHEDAIKEMFR